MKMMKDLGVVWPQANRHQIKQLTRLKHSNLNHLNVKSEWFNSLNLLIVSCSSFLKHIWQMWKVIQKWT